MKKYLIIILLFISSCIPEDDAPCQCYAYTSLVSFQNDIRILSLQEVDDVGCTEELEEIRGDTLYQIHCTN